MSTSQISIRHRIQPFLGWLARHQTLTAAGCVFIFGLAIFFPLLRGDVPLPTRSINGFFTGEAGRTNQSSIFRDRIVQTYPYHLFAVRAIQHGEFPLWNNLIFAGTPFFANGQSGLLSPLKLLFWGLPAWLSFNVVTIIQFLVGGLGLFLLGRYWGWSTGSALAAAIVFVGSGPFVMRATVLTMSAVIAWLPWLWLTIHRLHDELRWRRVAAVSGVIALMIFSGHIQLAFLSIVFSGLWALAWWQRKYFWRRAVMFAVAFTIGTGLSSVQLLPVQEANANGYRQPPKSEWSWVLKPSRLLKFSSLNALALATTADPNALGTETKYRGPSNFLEADLFIGIISLILVILSLVSWRQRLWRTVFIFSAVMVWVLCFPATWTLFGKVIPRLTLTPLWRLSFFLTFCLAIMAGIGFQRWFAKRPKWAWTIGLLLPLTMWWQWRDVLPFAPRATLYPANQLLETARMQTSGGRLLPVDGALDNYMPAELPVVFGYDSLYPKSYLELWRVNSKLRKRNQLQAVDIQPNLLAVTGTATMLLHRAPPAGWREIAQQDGWWLAVNDANSSAAWTVKRLLTADQAKVIQTIDAKNEATVFGATPELDPEAKTKLVTTNDVAARLSMTLETTGQTAVVTNRQFYPGWKAYVDGQPATALRVNYAFLGVAVPSGAHTIEFAYQPNSWRWGMIASSVALLLWGGLWWLDRQQNKKHPA